VEEVSQEALTGKGESVGCGTLLRSVCVPVFANQLMLKSCNLTRGDPSTSEFQAIIDDDATKTKFVITFKGRVLCLQDGNGYFTSLFLMRSQLPIAPKVDDSIDDHVCIYLGSSHDNIAYVCIENNDEGGEAIWLSMNDNAVFKSLRDIGECMDDDDIVAMLGHACGFATWHMRTKHCVKCGSLLKSERSGHIRRCTNSTCAVGSYPRIEPACIQLVESPCGNNALLGRKKIWPTGRYSCLAGFVEIGETVEQCVIRETAEESGVKILPESIVYKCSQPWPFPSSLMIGYFAVAAGHRDEGLPSITVQEEEMEDVQWFSKDEIVVALQSGPGSTSLMNVLTPMTTAAETQPQQLQLPGKASVARYLISLWADQDKAN
jgi:NAD+ diphosphatase